jgi:dTDP-glucose pyrophosphorylase
MSPSTLSEVRPWRSALLAPEATVQEAIANLNRSTLQIVLVADAEGRLVGTVTDGDIRRGLLRGIALTDGVESIIVRQPLVVTPQLTRDLVLQLMHANRVRQLPIVDAQRYVVGLHTWDAIQSPDRLSNLMVIMAGGKGTRLRPHTEHCPKPMLPVGGRPMLEHIIERAKASGFHRFVLAVHYLGHMIEEHFEDGSKWGVDIAYVREQEPLGTAGALCLITPRPTAPLVVTNGDVMTDIRYHEVLEFHHRHGAAGTMAVRTHEWQHPFGVVRTEGMDIIGFEEKPVSRSHINAGIYALEPEALDVLIPGEPCDMPTLFMRLRERSGRTIVYPMHEPWLDVGEEDDLNRARSAERNAS